jgi:exopolyphosphatase/guanosine-5'-triphosphate,3'-diphosphate pyrophosphatase
MSGLEPGPGLGLGLGEVRRACIDIGSNTTRLLVAACDPGGVREIHQERVFTRIGHGLRDDASIPQAKLKEVAAVVAAQVTLAGELGVDTSQIHGVATAAIRRAGNGAELLSAIESACGLAVRVLSAEEEARLAFVGAAGTLGHVPSGPLGVVDVGGGSSELVVGTAPDSVGWWASFALGSGDLAEDFLRSDPPELSELSAARAHVAGTVVGIEPPPPVEAVAVGGSAASLLRLAGPRLDAASLDRALVLLTSRRASEIARRFGLDRDRVRLLPAGLVILEAVSRLFGVGLSVGSGGIREGVLLEAAAR